MFRHYLRKHEDDREKYSLIKLNLVRNNPNGFKRIKNSKLVRKISYILNLKVVIQPGLPEGKNK